MTIILEKLFNKNRLDGNILQLLLLLLYTPIGILLMIIRLFISVQFIIAVRILPERSATTRVILRCLCGVLGLVVREKNAPPPPLVEDSKEHYSSDESADGRHAILSNHITPFDHFALSLVTPCAKFSFNGEGVPWLLSVLLRDKQLHLMNPPRGPSSRFALRFDLSRRNERFVQKIKNVLKNATTVEKKLPLLLFPEDATTNGSAALMKYTDWAVSIACNRPSLVCLKVERVPPIPLKAAGVLNSNFTQDLLTLFFCPLTVFTVQYLGTHLRMADESDSDFSKRLQNITSSALNIETTNYAIDEKIEYMKRSLRDQRSQWNEEMRPELVPLGIRVQEVLPHVSMTDIMREIGATQDVDATITNFLEGRAAITQTRTSTEPSQHERRMNTEETSLEHTPSISPINLSTKASTFSSSSSQRMTSYKERKNALIENALRKYVEKFGLHGENDPYLHKKSS